jgi:hypothetical protein
MKNIIIWAVIAAFAPAFAHASYMSGRAIWDQLDPASKAAYAMGVYDASNILFASDDEYTRAIKKGRINCLADEALPSDRLATLVDEAYETDPGLASQAPSKVLIQLVTARCERQIREEGAKLSAPISK